MSSPTSQVAGNVVSISPSQYHKSVPQEKLKGRLSLCGQAQVDSWEGLLSQSDCSWEETIMVMLSDISEEIFQKIKQEQETPSLQ